MKDCALYEIHLTDYAAGELTEPVLSALESHLGHCSACRDELAREIELRTVLGSLPLAQCPDTVTQNVQHGNERHAPIATDRRSPWWPAGLSLVAAALLAVLLMPEFVRGPHNPGPIAFDSEIAAPNFSAAEIAQARRDVIATLALAVDVLDRSRNQTVVNVFGARLPAAISGTLRPLSSDAQNHNNPTESNPSGGNG